MFLLCLSFQTFAIVVQQNGTGEARDWGVDCSVDGRLIDMTVLRPHFKSFTCSHIFFEEDGEGRKGDLTFAALVRASLIIVLAGILIIDRGRPTSKEKPLLISSAWTRSEPSQSRSGGSPARNARDAEPQLSPASVSRRRTVKSATLSFFLALELLMILDWVAVPSEETGHVVLLA